MAVITGTTGNDPLNGTSGSDTITGLGGDDTITGGAGNDTLDGGDGSDTYLVGAGAGYDTYKDTGTTGTDTILATADNAVIGLGSAFNAVSGIEAIGAGGHAGVTIAGNALNNSFSFSGTTLTGITAIDGGAGNDTITGSNGADTIIGGVGNDTLNGGDGGDTYLVGLGAGLDAIKDTGAVSDDASSPPRTTPSSASVRWAESRRSRQWSCRRDDFRRYQQRVLASRRQR